MPCSVLKNRENLAPYDGEIFLIRSFFPPDQADRLFNVLIKNVAWKKEDIFIFGRWVKVPRLMAWYGDRRAEYTYSGVRHRPLPWTDDLIFIRKSIEHCCQQDFNSVLANLYRDGRDSMGCHADDEKELGLNPMIASLSFGEERLFRLRHNKTQQRLDLALGHGDLLVMAGSLQHQWRHEVPKTRAKKDERINLTFRKILFEQD